MSVLGHDHDQGRLTIGCYACIEQVRTDQIVDQFVEWFQTCEWDEPQLPDRAPHGLRLLKVYRALRGHGYERHEVRGALALWRIEWTDRTGEPTTDPARLL